MNRVNDILREIGVLESFGRDRFSGGFLYDDEIALLREELNGIYEERKRIKDLFTSWCNRMDIVVEPSDYRELFGDE
jgi:hypothetical protein